MRSDFSNENHDIKKNAKTVEKYSSWNQVLNILMDF